MSRIGFLDFVSCRTVHGWAWCPSRPEERQFVWLYANGKLAGVAIANRYRSDLAASGIGDGRHGFAFSIPDWVGELEQVEARFDDLVTPLEVSRPDPIESERNRPAEATWQPGPGCRFPSLFVLGACKSGTTSLHFYLGQHPEVCMSEPKEPYFFEAEYDRGAAYYFNRYFSHWRGEPAVGESRHRNLYLPFVAPRLFAHNPNARLLVTVRNPVERLVSHWWHFFSRQVEDLDLEASVDADLRRINAGRRYLTQDEQRAYEEHLIGEERLTGDERGPFRTYVDSGYYAEQIDRYVSLFGRDRIRVTLFDDLVARPSATMKGIFEFLGLDAAPAEGFEYSIQNPSQPGLRAHLTDDLLRRLVDHYRPHNALLEGLLGRSLAAWDHPYAPGTQ